MPGVPSVSEISTSCVGTGATSCANATPMAIAAQKTARVGFSICYFSPAPPAALCLRGLRRSALAWATVRSVSSSFARFRLFLLRRRCLPFSFELRRALDDRREHGARFSAFRRTVRAPHGRHVLGEDVFEVAAALDALGREFGDVELARPVVAMLDQQPLAGIATSTAAAGAHEYPRSFQLVAVERELE